MTIPAVPLTGGKLSEFGGLAAVRQFRVWVHPKNGKADEFFTLSPARVRAHGGIIGLRKEATKLRRSGKYMRVEVPIAVVWDAKKKKYREVVIDVTK